MYIGSYVCASFSRLQSILCMRRNYSHCIHNKYIARCVKRPLSNGPRARIPILMFQFNQSKKVAIFISLPVEGLIRLVSDHAGYDTSCTPSLCLRTSYENNNLQNVSFIKEYYIWIVSLKTLAQYYHTRVLERSNFLSLCSDFDCSAPNMWTAEKENAFFFVFFCT